MWSERCFTINPLKLIIRTLKEEAGEILNNKTCSSISPSFYDVLSIFIFVSVVCLILHDFILFSDFLLDANFFDKAVNNFYKRRLKR